MDELRALFAALKFSNVATFIASGNVIFESQSTDASALEAKIEKHLEKALGYDVGAFVRSCQEVADIAACEPFATHTDRRTFVVFLKSAPDKVMLQKVMALATKDDAFHARQRELFWQSRGSFSESPAAGPFGKIVGPNGTTRSVTTIRKLAAKYRG
jgi:uncharacterized protein (DUF1697 family)